MVLDKHELREIAESLLRVATKEVMIKVQLEEQETKFVIDTQGNVTVTNPTENNYHDFGDLENHLQINYKGEADVVEIQLDGTTITPDAASSQVEWFLRVLSKVTYGSSRCSLTIVKNNTLTNLDILANDIVYRKYKSPDGNQIILFRNSLTQVADKFSDYEVVTHNTLDDGLTEAGYKKVHSATARSSVRSFKVVDCVEEEGLRA